MSFIGSLHQTSFYGLIVTIYCLLTDKISISVLAASAFHPKGITGIFLCYLFWATLLFVPIAIIGSFLTRENDDGLTFSSDNIFVIIFAHIAEEILGILLTPIWFVKDCLTQNFDSWKILDYFIYFLTAFFIGIGLIAL